MLLLQQMIVLFIYMMIGYFASKKNIIDEEFGKKISWLVVKVANPMLMISAVVNSETLIEGKDLVVNVLAAVSISGVLLILAPIIPVILRVPKEDRSVYKVMTVFNNIAFMGFPVIIAIHGQDALLYAVVFTIIFNLLVYTWGIQMLCGKAGEKIQWKQILNVGIISSFIAIFLYLTRLPVPQFVKTATSGLSNLTGPLSMIVIGISLTRFPLLELFKDGRLIAYSLIKLLVIPLAVMSVLNRCIDNPMLCSVCMVMVSTPVASLCSMLSQQYGGNYELVSKGIALSTVLSVITIPIVSMIVL